MTAKQKLFSLTASMGIVVDDNSTSDVFDHTLVAPNGMTFDATGTHILCTHQNKGFGAAAVAEYWQAMYSDIDYGLIACPEKDCDVCNEPKPAETAQLHIVALHQ